MWGWVQLQLLLPKSHYAYYFLPNWRSVKVAVSPEYVWLSVGLALAESMMALALLPEFVSAQVCGQCA